MARLSAQLRFTPLPLPLPLRKPLHSMVAIVQNETKVGLFYFLVGMGVEDRYLATICISYQYILFHLHLICSL